MGWVSYKTGADDTGPGVACELHLPTTSVASAGIHFFSQPSPVSSALIRISLVHSPSFTSLHHRMHHVPTRCDSDSLLPNVLAQVT